MKSNNNTTNGFIPSSFKFIASRIKTASSGSRSSHSNKDQIYCFDALTLESKFSVLTHPVPELGGQGVVGVNIGYGPMALGPRWLAYASNSPLLSNKSRLSPQSVTPPAVSPSTSPSNGNPVARYALESSKHLAAGLINLSDKGYRTLSKYYQDLMPDGSNSPVSSNSIWKASRFTPPTPETDTTGVVVVKDFVSRAVVAQFKAHTSPISALCFDPSGTLLVTASIHGNNINIFRIMPSSSRNGSGHQSTDVSYSHVHLYKLHRGLTSAVIQDICFSHMSQWVAIISSKGTCHIFALAPFGGETVLQIHSHDTEGPILFPALSLPWWFTPHFTVNQQQSCPAPPPPVVLSVVSRIKNNAGWLNIVSNATSSAAGKVCIPSGAVSAVFHSSISCDTGNTTSNIHALEYLLVYAPSGHLIQYKLLPSLGPEPSGTVPRMDSVPSAHTEEENLRVKVEPVQWWDVCRRNDWPEKEVHIVGNNLGLEAAEIILGTSDREDNNVGNNNCIKFNDQCHFSNAEVQINSGRIPIWQKSEVSFFVMSPLVTKELILRESSTSGEIEIENIPIDEVEIRRKNLLPVFDHFHRVDRGIVMGRSSSSSSDSHGAEEKFSGDAVLSHSKLKIPGSALKADAGLSGYFSSSIDSSGSDINVKNREEYVSESPLPSLKTVNMDDIAAGGSQVNSSKGGKANESLNSSFNGCNLNMNVTHDGLVHDSPDFGQIFQEDYSKASIGCPESAEVVSDEECSSPCVREKSEEDGDDDGMLGGVFEFSEEG
nr:autophagy-related protein 18h isoform X2 [Arachis hypogaea]